MLTFSIVVLLQSVAAIPTPTDGSTVHRESSFLPIPEQIAPALTPYFICTNKAENDELANGGISNGAAYRAMRRRAVASCATTRDQVKNESISMLSKSKMTAVEKEKFVEDALLAVDQPSEAVAARLDRGQAAASAAKKDQ